MVVLPTYIDLFGSESEAITYYKSLFSPALQIPDDEIKSLLNTSYMKIDPIFGEFREYTVGENTVRNEHVKRSVCFEANSILTANGGSGNGIVIGGINNGGNGSDEIKSEKIGNITTVYKDKSTSTGGSLGDRSIADTLGLLSEDAGILLSRYIKKSYAWSGNGYINDRGSNADRFGC